MPATSPELRERVRACEWYHTLELAPGVVTPGWFDLRTLPARLPLPARLDGLRCLDVGTFDGFWAFTLEERGAEEVVAIDVLDPHGWDWPVGSDEETLAALERRKRSGHGFELAAELKGSRVQRRELSVYDLSPGEMGEFDWIFVGSLLLHLRDPVGALARVRSVCRGSLLVLDAIDLPLTLRAPRRPLASLDAAGRPWWWRPNRAALVRMVEAAGFRLLAAPQTVRIPAGAGHPRPPLGAKALRSRTGRELLWASRRGAPHVAVLAAP